MEKISLLLSGGLTGTAIVTLLGIAIRAFPIYVTWAYCVAGISAIAFGALLSTRNPDIATWTIVIIFFGLFGVILAGLGG